MGMSNGNNGNGSGNNGIGMGKSLPEGQLLKHHFE